MRAAWISRARCSAAIDERLLGGRQHWAGARAYRTGWYAPRAGSYLKIRRAGGTEALRRLRRSAAADRPNADGSRRLHQRRGAIDWNANGIAGGTARRISTSTASATALNAGANDWANIRLRQLGSRRNVGGMFVDRPRACLTRGAARRSTSDAATSGAATSAVATSAAAISAAGDIGRGDIGQGDIGRGDIGRGDIGRGDIGAGDLFDSAGEMDDGDRDRARQHAAARTAGVRRRRRRLRAARAVPSRQAELEGADRRQRRRSTAPTAMQEPRSRRARPRRSSRK